MTLSWYWGLTSILMNGLYILQTNNDDNTDIDIGRIVNHH